MSDIAKSLKKHKRQQNMCRQSRMSLAEGKNIGPYEIIDLLKEGSSSKVYLAKSKYTNELVAIKTINKAPLKNNLDELLLITKQMETLKILKHRNIVTLYEIYESKKNIFLVTEYLSGKDLIEKIIRKKRFNEEEALRIFFQLLDAFTYMHKMNICHRNIRVEHILFDKNNRPKIIGFGYSSFYEKNKTIEGAYGSLCYACPEIIDEIPYNPELADVWSLGVILYVLICGYLPFSDEDDNKNKILISNGKIEFPKEISNKLKDLLRHMLDKNPKKRYTFQKIVKHPWIKPLSEKIFSEGINIYKTIYPVDERILNIVNEYGLDKNKIKNDLIKNKYNTGTGLYKQIVRKLLDLKIKNISDLWSEEFMAYRDDKKNKYEDGDKKYEDYILKVDERYRKKEDFVNDFKEREDYVAERLLFLKDKKEEEKLNEKDKKNKLNVIEEDIVDYADKKDNEKNNKSFKEDEKKEDIRKKKEMEIEENNNKTTKTQRKKLFPKTKTPLYTFRELMSAKKNNINNNNMFNSENVEIVYNKDQDIDIIQQFQDEQNKKLSENIIIEKPTHKKTPSTPNLGKELLPKKEVVHKTNPFKLSITPEKKNNYAKKLLVKNKDNISDKDTQGLTYSINSNNNIKNSMYSNININNSIYSNINTKNSMFSNINNVNNINNIYSGNVGNNDKNYYKSIISGLTLQTLPSNNSNNNAKSLFRMTCVRKSNNKSYFDRGSLYDNFLKKNHPDNVRKTMLKDSQFGKKNIFNSIDEGIKENDESESEKEEKEENDEKKENEANELKKSIRLKYSLSFGDDDEEEDVDENDNSMGSKDGDLKLFNILENENDPELKELKNIYFNENPSEKDLKKSMVKKKQVKFRNDREKKGENSPDPNLKKSYISKLTNNSNADGSFFEGFDKFEERLKEHNKNIRINDSSDNNFGHVKLNSQLEISFNENPDGKYLISMHDNNNYNNFNNDIVPIRKLDYINNNDIWFNVNNIYNTIKKNYILKINEDKPNKKLNLLNEGENINSIDKINKIFLNKNKDKIKKDKNKNDNLNMNSYQNNSDEIPSQKNEKSSMNKENYKITNETGRSRRNSRNKNISPRKDDSTQTYFKIKLPFENIGKKKQSSFSIYPNNQNINLDNNTYNGNNTNKFNTYNGNTDNPNSTYSTNPDNKINKALKKYYYKNDNNNNTVDKDTIKVNRSKYFKIESPKKNKNSSKNKKENFPNVDNKKLNKYNTNTQIPTFKTYYNEKYENMLSNISSKEEPKYSSNTEKKNDGYSSVKYIKDEVIVKRNEIVEKIQHCQNLLNIILKDKKSNYMSNIKDESNTNQTIDDDINNKTFSNFYTNNLLEPTTYKKIKKDININHFNSIDNRCRIKQIFVNKDNGQRTKKNLKYNQFSFNDNESVNSNKYTSEFNEKDSINISLPQSYTKVSNTKKKIYLKKGQRENTIPYSKPAQYSYDNQEKKLSKNDTDQRTISPKRKLIEIYRRYENKILANKSNSNGHNRNLTNNNSYSNKTFNKTYFNNLNKMNSNDSDYITYKGDSFSKNFFRNKNEDKPITKILLSKKFK